MIRLTLNLPTRYRLDVSIVKSRKLEKTPIFPDLGKVLRVQKGSKISRYFRHIFENKRIKKIMGGNLAMAMIITGSVIKPVPNYAKGATEVDQSIHEELVIKTEREIRYPLNNIKINQGYNVLFHPGIDFDGEIGDPVYPFAAGEVVEIEHSSFGYGNAIIINHGEGRTSLYAHLSKINIKAGDFVDTYDVIGLVGSTGRSTGSHLHFEYHENGKAINPLTILPTIK